MQLEVGVVGNDVIFKFRETQETTLRPCCARCFRVDTKNGWAWGEVMGGRKRRMGLISVIWLVESF